MWTNKSMHLYVGPYGLIVLKLFNIRQNQVTLEVTCIWYNKHACRKWHFKNQSQNGFPNVIRYVSLQQVSPCTFCCVKGELDYRQNASSWNHMPVLNILKITTNNMNMGLVSVHDENDLKQPVSISVSFLSLPGFESAEKRINKEVL